MCLPSMPIFLSRRSRKTADDIFPECFSVCPACVTPEGGQPLSPEALKGLFLSRQFLEKEENGYADPFHGPIGPAEYED